MAGLLKLILINGNFPDYYDMLKIARNASLRDITQAYRKVALEQHPDKVGGGQAQNEVFAHINNAKDVLTDPVKRAQYDVQLEKHHPAPRPQDPPPYVPCPNVPHPNAPPPFPKEADFGFNPFCDNPYNYSSFRRPSRPSPWDNYSNFNPYNTAPFDQSQEWTHSPRPPRRTPPKPKPDPRGDPAFIPRSFPVTFRNFVPPASHYPVNPSKGLYGTKPDSRFWWEPTEDNMSVGGIHDAVCVTAVKICWIAEGINRFIVGIEEIAMTSACQPPVFDDPNMLRGRFRCALSIISEIMHFVACAYRFIRNEIDWSVSQTTSVAMILLPQHDQQLLDLAAIMSETRASLMAIGPVLQTTTKSVTDGTEALRGIFEAWSEFCVLPNKLKEAGKDTFGTTFEEWANSWERGGEYEVKWFEKKVGEEE